MQHPFPHMEVLPHPLEVAIDTTRRAFKYVRSLVMNTNVQLCESDYYVREHFTDEPVKPAGGLPPARRFED